MLEQLQSLEDRYEKLNELLSDPDIGSNPDKLREYSKEQAGLTDAVTAYRRYKEVTRELADAKEMLELESDEDMVEMVKLEKEELEDEIKILLIPKDPNDDKNVIVEIRAAAGGDEAALFAGDLYRMYAKYAENKGWKTEVIESHTTGVGGYKEITFMINGSGAYSQLKFENGAHRVQRVPETESGGRIHTSTATVAVLAEAEDVEVDVKESDIRVDRFASSGPGGQSVNTTMSAVRLTHEPTGIIVS